MKFSLVALLSAATLTVATPPGIPSEATARSQLSQLTVGTITDDGSYDRDLFPHWSTVEGTCSAREYVLRRDGSGVSTGSDCYPTSGSWTCPYSGVRHTAPGDVDIDHMVPLKNAWISGASSWSTSRREQFANDISGPQLWATDGSTNSAKSDKSPDQWKPPLTSMYCNYAKSWIQVKSTYGLRISAAEQSALESMLGSC